MPRGRSRDDDARRRILDATHDLIGTRGPLSVTINDIVEAAGVGKQTIYRWWPSRTAVILDALVEASLRATPFNICDDALREFHDHIVSVIGLFNSPTGQLIRSLLAESQGDEAVAREFLDLFWSPRRRIAMERFQAGVARGELRADIDPSTALDLLYGPIWLRFVIRHQVMSIAFADELLHVVWPAFSCKQSPAGHAPGGDRLGSVGTGP